LAVWPKHLALHEAGHAVAAIRLRLSLRYTMLEAREPHDGSTVISPRPNGSPDRDRREAVLAFAAHEARLMDIGKDFDDFDFLVRFECDHDFRAARALAARHVSEEGLDAWLADRRKDARALVVADWDAIQAVTSAILARRKLYGAEVRALVLGR
jgi:hypothetical protein